MFEQKGGTKTVKGKVGGNEGLLGPNSVEGPQGYTLDHRKHETNHQSRGKIMKEETSKAQKGKKQHLNERNQ